MAEKRMFSNKILSDDRFISLPLSAQALYFHLCMAADDDGLINNAISILRTIGAKEEDLTKLQSSDYILCFNSGIIAVLHWNMHNHISKKLYKPSIFIEEKEYLQTSNTVYARTMHELTAPNTNY